MIVSYIHSVTKRFTRNLEKDLVHEVKKFVKEIKYPNNCAVRPQYFLYVLSA